MDIEDRELEALLRSMPLARPSIAMDARVMGSRPKKRSPLVLTIFGSGALAAAAALVLAVTLGWFGQSAPVVDQPNVDQADNTNLLPVKMVDDLKVIDSNVAPGNTTNPNPVQEIRAKNTRTYTWVDKLNGIHVENETKPHNETITITTQVD